MKTRHFVLLGLGTLGGALVSYGFLTYQAIPAVWRHKMKRHPALASAAPRTTWTTIGIPGDPLNIALVGTEDEAVHCMLAAGWEPADPVTLKSSLRIVKSAIFHKPYETAPVSPLLLFGRKQDLAFEQEVGHDARKRHHVRFWQSAERDDEGRPLWFGAATYDTKVGLSHTTGQVTHHIGPDLDAERDKIVADLQRADVVKDTDYVEDFHDRSEGKNGGGDPYHTDRRLAVVALDQTPGSSVTLR